MRIDIDQYPFAGVVNQGNLAIVDLSGAEYAAIGVAFSAFSGSPTTMRVEVSMVDSMAATNDFNSGDVFGSIDITGAPVTAPKNIMVSRIGAEQATKTVILSEGFLLPPPLKYARVHVDLAGGAAPTATGTVFIFKYTR